MSSYDVITNIFSWYASGTYSHRRIADALNARGCRILHWKTGERKLFGRESVRAILKNTAYIGNVQCSDVLYAGNHPPLVDQETWEQCQRIQRERNRGGRGHTHQDGWLLSRIVRCARVNYSEEISTIIV